MKLLTSQRSVMYKLYNKSIKKSPNLEVSCLLCVRSVLTLSRWTRDMCITWILEYIRLLSNLWMATWKLNRFMLGNVEFHDLSSRSVEAPCSSNLPYMPPDMGGYQIQHSYVCYLVVALNSTLFIIRHSIRAGAKHTFVRNPKRAIAAASARSCTYWAHTAHRRSSHLDCAKWQFLRVRARVERRVMSL